MRQEHLASRSKSPSSDTLTSSSIEYYDVRSYNELLSKISKLISSKLSNTTNDMNNVSSSNQDYVNMNSAAAAAVAGGGVHCGSAYVKMDKENESTISFYQRVPHSASFYGATVGDSIHDRRVEFEEIHDLSLIKELRHPLVIRQKARDKLARQGIVPNFPFDRLSIPEGGWVVLLPKS